MSKPWPGSPVGAIPGPWNIIGARAGAALEYRNLFLEVAGVIVGLGLMSLLIPTELSASAVTATPQTKSAVNICVCLLLGSIPFLVAGWDTRIQIGRRAAQTG